MFNFSLKAKTEPMHTIIIPSPLNSGNRIIDGTLAASPVITKLITDSEIALPNAHKPIVFLCFRLILFMFFGFENGCIGETSAFLLLIGAFYLMLRRIITPTIPFSYIGTVALLALIFGDNVSITVFGGGLMLGALFMATDYTTSPTTELGKLIFGIGCGVITFIIRKFAALPEGVSYAILIMNILVPYINRLTLKKPFGYIKPVTASEEKTQE